MTPNLLGGEFTATLAGTTIGFDTRLGTIARLEDCCGGRTVLEIVNAVVTGRRAADQVALLSAALQAGGRPPAEAAALAEGATVPEAEAFILALMAALGFRLTPHPGEAGDDVPLDGTSAGGAGAPSRSAA